MDKEWTRVGRIGVDAGLCWIGDPCYILHKSKPPKALGRSWAEFCDGLNGEGPTVKSFDYDLGHEGLGVCLSTGYGDGAYGVWIRKSSDGRIAEARIVFIEEDAEGNERHPYEMDAPPSDKPNIFDALRGKPQA